MLTSYKGVPTANQKKAVSTLIYHCGIASETEYDPYESTTNTSYILSAFRDYFGYNKNISFIRKSDMPKWEQLLKEELNNSHPILYLGYKTGGNGGHAWICDGYDSSGKFHFNWGWGGSNDGYFETNVTPTYNYNHAAIYGIYPNFADLQINMPIQSFDRYGWCLACINPDISIGSDITKYETPIGLQINKNKPKYYI